MSFEFDDPTAGKKKKKGSKKIKAGRDVKIKKKKSKKAGRDIIGKKSNVINIKNVMGGKGGGGSGSGGGGASGASGAQGAQGAQGIQGPAGPTVFQPSPAPHIPQGTYAAPVYQNDNTPGFDMSSRASSQQPYVPFYIPTPTAQSVSEESVTWSDPEYSMGTPTESSGGSVRSAQPPPTAQRSVKSLSSSRTGPAPSPAPPPAPEPPGIISSSVPGELPSPYPPPPAPEPSPSPPPPPGIIKGSVPAEKPSPSPPPPIPAVPERPTKQEQERLAHAQAHQAALIATLDATAKKLQEATASGLLTQEQKDQGDRKIQQLESALEQAGVSTQTAQHQRSFAAKQARKLKKELKNQKAEGEQMLAAGQKLQADNAEMRARGQQLEADNAGIRAHGQQLANYASAVTTQAQADRAGRARSEARLSRAQKDAFQRQRALFQQGDFLARKRVLSDTGSAVGSSGRTKRPSADTLAIQRQSRADEAARGRPGGEPPQFREGLGSAVSRRMPQPRARSVANLRDFKLEQADQHLARLGGQSGYDVKREQLQAVGHLPAVARSASSRSDRSGGGSIQRPQNNADEAAQLAWQQRLEEEGRAQAVRQAGADPRADTSGVEAGRAVSSEEQSDERQRAAEAAGQVLEL